ncbi:MAG: prolipoprotein diacylglyceryl transferase [Chloroflexi bacterium]|nr:prolipoprotein diacylglyceryl transferase [Chloroflexota bacterium]MQC17285.1 prolipoprotein diacylglyceryl transferase [Chloroflexota bacterium]
MISLAGALLAIEIPWDPDIARIGGFLLTWHGLFTAVGILVGVQLALWLARRIDFDVDDAYTLALIGIPSGILGARLLFVAEHWDHYGNNLGDIVAITEGGISVWGAVLGGVLFPLLYALWRRWDVWKGLDAASVGLIAGLAIGRIGDLINGEHLARATDLPWGVVYTHPDSPAFAHSLVVGAHHPATTYEMLALFALLGVAIYLARGPWMRRPGLTFFLFLATYSVLRYALSELRLDSAETFIAGVTVPQLVSIVVVLITIPPVVYILRRPPLADGGTTGGAPRRQAGSRAR